MSSSDTHTPLPWKVEEGHIQRDSNGIRYWQITDGQDAIACNQFCYAGYDPEVNAANAAFIVHAVNSHHDLIEALREARTELSLTRTNIMCEINRCTDPRDSRWEGVPEILKERIAKIDAILTKEAGHG